MKLKLEQNKKEKNKNKFELFSKKFNIHNLETKDEKKVIIKK